MTDVQELIAKARQSEKLPAFDVLPLLGRLADALEELDVRLRLAEQNIRIREQSQIPMIPLGAQEQMARLEREKANYAARYERAEQALRSIADGDLKAPTGFTTTIRDTDGVDRPAVYVHEVSPAQVAREALDALEASA